MPFVSVVDAPPIACLRQLEQCQQAERYSNGSVTQCLANSTHLVKQVNELNATSVTLSSNVSQLKKRVAALNVENVFLLANITQIHSVCDLIRTFLLQLFVECVNVANPSHGM